MPSRRSQILILVLRSVASSLFCFSLLWTGDAFAQQPFEILFNGKDLTGWAGNKDLWTVEQGAIVGQTTKDNPTARNTFLILQTSPIADFDFRCKVRFTGNNSGVQYRSKVIDQDKFVMHGNQADLHPKQEYFGMLYGEGIRGIVATRGQTVEVSPEGNKNVTEQVDHASELTGDQWNDLRIVAVGNRLIHIVNGETTVDITDNDTKSNPSGALGLQLHAGAPMKVEFRNLLLKRMNATDGKRLIASLKPSEKPSKSSTNTESKSDSSRLKNGKWIVSKPVAQWIWADTSTTDQTIWFRHSFQLGSVPKVAPLYTTCDNEMRLWINGKEVGKSGAWEKPIQQDVAKFLNQGKNVIAIQGKNHGGIAGLTFKLYCEQKDQSPRIVTTSEKTWKMNPKTSNGWNQIDFDDSKWQWAKKVGKLGDAPWRVPQYAGRSGGENKRLDAKNIIVPAGFIVDHVYTVPQDQGSWVSLTTDPQGRIYACDQGRAGLYRITLTNQTASGTETKATGSDSKVEKIEKVSVGSLEKLSGAQGMLWAFDSLWFHRNGGHLYRLTDSNGDDQLDTMKEIPSTTGGGEHGNHALILTPDKTGIYMNSGNHSKLADHVASRVQSWDEDLLLPRMSDSNGHANGVMAPGGWVTWLDPKTETQTVHAIGFRNQYDIALNRFGDMFTYDADMEYDMGSPWYRPTRICHVVSGADFGWRHGSGKWPSYYEDSLPAVVDIGPGSPTGVVNGGGTKFPTRYQAATFALDWTFGTIYAIHMKPDGASYSGEAEPFVYSSPLPVTDAIVGHDGALYFAVGGRGTQSAMFRVRYIGDESTEPPAEIADELSQEEQTAATMRQKRHQLEAFHGIKNNKAIAACWPMLTHSDRFLRHAARVGIESQPVEQWANRVFTETQPQAKITGAVALARMGNESHRAPLLEMLGRLNTATLDRGQLLGMLRAYSLTMIRLGSMTPEERQQAVAKLDALFPHSNADVNTELIRVLTYLQSKTVASKAMDLIANRKAPQIPEWSTLASRNKNYGGTVERMLANHPPTQELAYAFILRNLRRGWTDETRRQYFSFINEAAKAAGGASYAKYLTRMREEALATCSDDERSALVDLTNEDFNPVPDFPIIKPAGPGKKWSVDEALQVVKRKSNFEKGRSLFHGASCAQCHRVRGIGGNVGPDLTAIPSRFDQKYVVETIIHPSKHISDQYASSKILLEDGRAFNGLVVEQDNGMVAIYPDQVGAEPVIVSKDGIDEMKPSTVSQMPEKLLDGMNAEELNDLMGYLMAGGNPNNKRFKK